MGVHCVCVVFALLFNIVPVKSSNTDEDHLSIWYSKKKRFSLQNGFAWGTSYPEKVAIIPSSIILWNFHVLFSPPQSFPILSNFEAKICTQCACVVYVVSALLIHIVPSKSSKIIRIMWRYCLKKKGFLYKMGVHTPLVLQNGHACPHGLYFHVHVLFFFVDRLKIRKAVVALMVMMLSYPLWSASVSTH